MKHKVTDSDVNQYAERLRNGGPLGTLLPGKLSECAFTEAQREIIRKARADKRVLQKKTKEQPPVPSKNEVQLVEPAPAKSTKGSKPKPLTKLRRILYLQSGLCFFCGKPLQEEDANIEHLHPQSRGGTRTEDNEVVCHKSINETFGNLDLKQKFAFVLKSAGSFLCPNT